MRERKRKRGKEAEMKEGKIKEGEKGGRKSRKTF